MSLASQDGGYFYFKVLDSYRGSRDWRVSMKELQNLMSIGDVAGSFGVCVATVRRWCKNGKNSRESSEQWEIKDVLILMKFMKCFIRTAIKGSKSGMQESQVTISARI